MKTSPTVRASLAFVAGFILGALIWWASPFVTEQREPWDAPLGYYITALIFTGFLAALISPRHFWLVPIGIYLGQSVYALAFLPIGPMLPFGLVLGLGFCILALVGAAGAFGMWRMQQRL